jgi:hypothetical protein
VDNFSGNEETQRNKKGSKPLPIILPKSALLTAILCDRLQSCMSETSHPEFHLCSSVFICGQFFRK